MQAVDVRGLQRDSSAMHGSAGSDVRQSISKTAELPPIVNRGAAILSLQREVLGSATGGAGIDVTARLDQDVVFFVPPRMQNGARQQRELLFDQLRWESHSAG